MMKKKQLLSSITVKDSHQQGSADNYFGYQIFFGEEHLGKKNYYVSFKNLAYGGNAVKVSDTFLVGENQLLPIVSLRAKSTDVYRLVSDGNSTGFFRAWVSCESERETGVGHVEFNVHLDTTTAANKTYKFQLKLFRDEVYEQAYTFYLSSWDDVKHEVKRLNAGTYQVKLNDKSGELILEGDNEFVLNSEGSVNLDLTISAKYVAQHETLLEKLNQIELTGTEHTSSALERPATKVDALVLYIRLLGKENECLTSEHTHPFTDVPEWANKYVGWAYANGYVRGQSETVFGSNNIDKNTYASWMLMTLGYEQSRGDFTNENAFDLLKDYGVLDLSEWIDINEEIDFYWDNVVKMTYNTMRSFRKSGGSLSEELVNKGIMDNDALVEIGVLYNSNDSIRIADSNLFNELLSVVDTNKDKGISREEALAMTHLKLKGNIVDLSGLEYFTNLEYLELKDNVIEDLSVLSALENLDTLKLGNNQISDVSPLSDLHGLKWLELHGNNISNVEEISRLRNLMTLSLHDNDVTNIASLGHLVRMRRIVLDGDKIVDFTPLENMKYLYVLNLDQDSDFNDFDQAGIKQHYRGSDILSIENGIYDFEEFDMNRDGYLSIAEAYEVDRKLETSSSINPEDLVHFVNVPELRLSGGIDGSDEVIKFIGEMTSLERLFISRPMATNFEPLSHLDELKALYMTKGYMVADKEDNSYGLTDISTLAGLIHLEDLYIWGNSIDDISALGFLKKLKRTQS